MLFVFLFLLELFGLQRLQFLDRGELLRSLVREALRRELDAQRLLQQLDRAFSVGLGQHAQRRHDVVVVHEEVHALAGVELHAGLVVLQDVLHQLDAVRQAR